MNSFLVALSRSMRSHMGWEFSLAQARCVNAAWCSNQQRRRGDLELEDFNAIL